VVSIEWHVQAIVAQLIGENFRSCGFSAGVKIVHGKNNESQVIVRGKQKCQSVSLNSNLRIASIFFLTDYVLVVVITKLPARSPYAVWRDR